MTLENQSPIHNTKHQHNLFDTTLTAINLLLTNFLLHYQTRLKIKYCFTKHHVTLQTRHLSTHCKERIDTHIFHDDSFG